MEIGQPAENIFKRIPLPAQSTTEITIKVTMITGSSPTFHNAFILNATDEQINNGIFIYGSDPNREHIVTYPQD